MTSMIILALLLSFVPALIYAAMLYGLDIYEREPLFLLASVFGWGAGVAVVGAASFSMLLADSMTRMTGLETAGSLIGSTMIAPVVEESLKGLAVLLVFLRFRREFDSIMDGIVYASITALGFAATENVIYLANAGVTGGLEALWDLFVLRIGIGGLNHAAFTAWIGIGLAIARLSHSGSIRIAAPLAGWALAQMAHALHNMASVLVSSIGPCGWIVLLIVNGAGAAMLIGAVAWSILHEQHWIGLYLHEEVVLGTISPLQHRIAYSIRGQIVVRLHALCVGGYGTTNRFYHLCGKLAQKKHHCTILGDERGNIATIQHLRSELHKLAAQMATATVDQPCSHAIQRSSNQVVNVRRGLESISCK